jgi:DNA invertase Pin-like site-specific DNA recombinase
MRLVGYIRVSSNGQLDGFGPDVQRKAIRSWAKAHGHKVTHWCEDVLTGKTDVADRPGFQCVIEALRAGRADGVCLARLDRLARQLTVQEAALALLWKLGATIYCADGGEVQQDDPDDPMRTAIRQVMGVFAELDRKLIVKRLRDGRQAAAAAGQHSVGAYRYGHRDAEQKAIDRIAELRGCGMSYRDIAAQLDSEKLKPRRADTWSAMSVRNVVLRLEST